MDPARDSAVNGKSTTPTQSIRQNYTSVYSFACDVVAMPKFAVKSVHGRTLLTILSLRLHKSTVKNVQGKYIF